MTPPGSPGPNLLPIATLVCLLVLLLGLIGLFDLSASNRAASQALARIGDLRAAQVAAVEAQVSFKTQVQEWKNILLRGQNPADYRDYITRFDRAEASVRSGLAAASDCLDRLELDRSEVAGMLAEHAQLGAAYRRALSRYQPDSPGSAFAVDTSIRGIDRKLNGEIDALAHSVEQDAEVEIEHFRTAGATRYSVLRKVIFGGSGLAVLTTLWLVFQAARAGRPEPRPEVPSGR